MITGETEGDDWVSLVLFEIAGFTYGAALQSVAAVRGGRDQKGTILGTPRAATRRLEFTDESGHSQHLSIDAFHGIWRAPVNELRRLPQIVNNSPVVAGVWLRAGALILLIKLEQLQA
jgi:hypothetical protein